MGRHRIITLLGLTSLVATMVTITRYSSNFSEPTGRLIPQRMLAYHQQQQKQNSHHLNHHKNNDSLNSINYSNLVQSELIDKIVKIDNKLDEQKKIQSSVISLSPNSISNSLKSSSSQPPLIVESKNSGDIYSNNNKRESMPSLVNNINGGQSVTIKSTIDSDSKKQLIQDDNTNNDKDDNNDDNKSDTKTDNKNEFKIDIKNIIKNDIKSDVNIDVDQKIPETDNQQIQNEIYDNEHNYSKAVVKPKLVFDLEDLKTTESMKIDKPNGCDIDLGASLDLLVIVTSAVDHIEARNAIRKTWGKFAIERGAYLFFLIGNTVNVELQHKIDAEDAQFQDILQGRYIDNYFNLTLKTISMMKWISEKCNKVKYVLKVDDDMFINMQHITDFSETRTFGRAIIGKLAKKWKPHRNPNNKWYVPKNAFNRTVFPNFATGPAYMISGDAAKPLYETSIKLTPIYLEDVYMTGIVAEKASIRRLNHALMKNVNVRVDACTFRKIMTSHKHKPQDIIKLWDLVYSQPPKPCDSKAKKTSNNSKKSVLPSNSAQSAPRPVTPAKPRAAAAKK